MAPGINDVIRVRREMFGMTQKELCKGICDAVTLRRLERRETVTHREIAEKLFERLGLSGEFTRTNLVTASHEAKILMGELRKHVNQGQWDEARMLRERIEGLVDMDIPQNRQVLMRQESMARWRNQEITREEYLVKVTDALEQTLPRHVFCKEGEQYLTNEEQTCIQNMMKAMDETSDEYAAFAQKLEALYLPYADNGLQEAVANLYEFVMDFIGSWRGNRGDYEHSDQYGMNILTGCLRFRRSEMLERSLYNRWWNYNMRKSQGIPTAETLDDKEELTRCILFCRLNGQQRNEQLLQKKLDSVLRKE